MVRNAGYDGLKSSVILGILALVYPLTDKVTHNTSEVLVSGIGHEGTAVGKHTNKCRECAEVCKSLHLRLHAVALVVEPPAGAELDLACIACALEATEHSAENVIVLRVKGVENGLGKAICHLKVVHKCAEILCDAKVVDGVKAGVGTELVIHLSVIVTKGTNVELHSPVILNVLLCASLKHRSLEGVDFRLGKLLACHALVKSSLSVANSKGNVLKSVVGKTAAIVVEVCDTRLDPSNKLLVGLNAGGLYIGNEGFLADLNSLVRTECRKNLGRKVLESRVIFESIDGIVGGADDLNIRATDQLLCAELRLCKALVYLVPDALAGLLVKGLVNVEISLELKVCPVIKGVADKTRKCLCKHLELLVLVSAAGDEFLGNTVGSDLTPLVVVATKEEVKGIFELIVICDLLGRKVAMIVDNRKILYHCIKLLRRLVLEHKVIINKTHNVTPSLNIEISL